MRQETAEIIGLKALEFLAQDPEVFGSFLGFSGISAQHIQQNADQTETIIGILDYLLNDEELLLRFCAQADIAPDAPKMARMILSKEDYF